MSYLSYTVFDGQQWNSRRGLARFARQLRRHLEVAGWQDHPAVYPRWSSSLGRILISEVIEPYRHRRLRPEAAFYPHNVLPSWLSRGHSLHVLVLHDLLFLAPENRGLGNRYRRLKLSQSLDNADLILTVSEASKAAIQSMLRREIPVLVLPNCLAESFADIAFAPKPTSAAPTTILHFGGHVSSKNTFALMRAVAQMVEGGEEVRLEIASMANHAPLIERWRSMAGLPHSSVRLLPVLNDNELIEAYKRATIHAMPSTGEGFGIPVIEAARVGVLNVLTPIEVFREMIGPAAIYAARFDSEAIADALRASLAANRRPLIAHAHQQTHRYTFESVHAKYALPALERIAMLASSRKNARKER